MSKRLFQGKGWLFATVSFTALLAAVLICSPDRAFAQLTAQINGTITDPTGAVIPGAAVSVENEQTGIRWEAFTNDAGYYTVPLLQPGSYRITVQTEGFRAITRSGIQLAVAQTVKLDFRLEVGAVTESIDVTDTVPLLDTGTSAMGGVVSSDKVENVPKKGRNSSAFMALVPGVKIPSVSMNQPVFESHYQFFSINGSRPGQNQFVLDGANNNNVGFNGPEYSAQLESVQEFKVQTNNYSAEYSNAAGGVINIVTKGGTNELHGSFFEFFRNDAIQATNYFTKRSGLKKPPLRSNQFGGTVGGPVVKNRTFFYFGYEGLRFKLPLPQTTTVPTELQKAGDFSQTLAGSGALVRVHDPFSTAADPNNPGKFVRTQFANNRIPEAMMSSIAGNIQGYYPKPTSAGDPVTGLNNYFFNGSQPQNTNDYSGRIDHQINDSTMLTARVSSAWVHFERPNVLGSIADAYDDNTDQTHASGVVRLTKTYSATMFGEFVFSYNRFAHLRDSVSTNRFDPTDLGLPAYLAANSRLLGFPSFSIEGMSNIGRFRFEHDGYDRPEFRVNMTKVSGRHTLKFGALFDIARFNGESSDNAAGTYSFTKAFTQGPDPFQSTATSGLGYATFLLGTLSSGTHNPVEVHASTINRYYGFYVEDGYNVTPGLTLTLGLRYDYETPRIERRNQISNFDFTGTATLANGTLVRGGLQYPTVGGLPRGHWENSPTNFSPRFGFAYTVNDATVLRGGYGIFFGNSWGAGRNFNGLPNAGFSCATPVLASLDGGLTPAARLSDPFPTGFCTAPGNAAGLLTNLGQAVDFIDRNHPIPYSQSWNFNIQHKLPTDVLFEIAYAGSRGVHLAGVVDWNQIAPEHLALGTALNDKVANPFLGVIKEGSLSAATVTRGQLLRPFPQFLSVTSRDAMYGSSTYHAMYLKVERRFADGFSVLGSYTWSKLIDDVVPSRTFFPGICYNCGIPQNYYNLRGERSVSVFNTPHNLALSYVYELPFGPGKPLLNSGGVAGKVFGGWQVNGLTMFQSGQNLQITGGNSSGSLAGVQRPNWTGADARLEGDILNRLGAYFDTSAFTFNDPFTFGNAPRIMPNLAGPGVANFDVSLFKTTALTERVGLQIRVEAFNVFNRVQFGNPNTNLNSNAFGRISSQANSPREFQLGLRLTY
jgi:outer membrane receptor protein involved in Fe transport